MSAAAVLLVLASAALHVGWNVLTKASSDPKIFSLLKGTLLIGVALASLPAIPLAAIPGAAWFWIALSGVLHAVYIVALSTAYETGEISYVYPIARSAPAFVPFAAYLLLGEVISARGAAGIAIVVVSVLVIQLSGGDRGHGRGFLAYAAGKDSFWAYITLATVVGFSLVDKAGMVVFSSVPEEEMSRHARGLVYFLLENALCFLLFWGYAAGSRSMDVRPVWRREWPWILLAALITVVSYSLVLHVMQTEEISYIMALRQSAVLLAVGAGWFLLRERRGALRLAAALAMCLGLFLVAGAP